MIDKPDRAATVRERQKYARRIAAYWLTPIVLTIALLVFEFPVWLGNDDLHTDLEIIALVLAAVVGAMALARFYSRKDNTFLFIAVGFLGAAMLDGYHAVATSSHFRPLMPSDLPSLVPWSWMASRLFLSAALLYSVFAWRREQRLGEAGTYGESGVYLAAAGLLALTIAVFVLVPLPAMFYPGQFFPRPQDLAPAALFLAAAVGYLKKGRWREDPFEHWLIVGLIVGVVAQAAFMARSAVVFDYEFDVAHLLKVASYILPMIGLLTNTVATYREAESGERRFRAAIASMQEGFALYNAEDRLVIWNDEYLRLHPGLGDVITPGTKYEHIARTSLARKQVVGAIGREESFLRERLWLHRNPAGPILRELVDGTCCLINEVRLPDGSTVVTQTDITELREAERALRDSEERMRAFMDNSNQSMYVKAVDGRLILVNKNFEDRVGLPAREVIGKTVYDLFPKDIGDAYTEMDQEVLRTRQPASLEIELPNKDGRTRFNLTVKFPIVGRDGVPVAIGAVGTDITDRKRVEQALIEREALTRKILEASPVGVLIVTREGRHLFANERALEIQGVTRAELFAENAGAYYAESGLRARMKDDLYATGSTPPTEVELVKPDGTHFFVVLSSTLIEFEGQPAHITYLYDIDAIKRAQEAVRRSETLLRTIMDSVPALINVKDADGRYLMTNRHHSDFFGIPPNAWIGQTSAVISKEHGLAARAVDRVVVETGESVPPYDDKIHDAQGRERYILTVKNPLRDPDGDIAGIVTASVDITDRRLAEQALRDSESRLRSILDNATTEITLKDKERRFVIVNRAFLENHRLTEDQVIGKTLRDLLDDETVDRYDAVERWVLETGEVSRQELPAIGTPGVTYFLSTKFPIRDADGRIVSIGTINTDITRIKRTEQAIRDNEARTRAIVDNIIDGIVTIDAKGQIISVNPKVCEIFGYGDETDVIGRNVNILMPEPHRGAHDRYIANYLITGVGNAVGQTREVEAVRADGSRFPAEIAINEVPFEDERMFVGVVRDITERKEIERLKGEFVSTVSHELRTPLTSIRGSLGLLTGGAVGALPDKARAMVQMAEKNTARLINLVNDILDMEKLESGRMEFRFERLDLGKLVEQGIAAHEGYAREFGVEFVLAKAAKNVFVKGDQDRLTQVLANLLSNAAKFSPKRGKVIITVARRNGVGRVSVADRGPGIPKKFHDNIFGRFTQADASDARKVGGTGLGLNISRTIVERHGGTITFDTEVGTGTTFHFEVPLWAERPVAAGTAAS